MRSPAYLLTVCALCTTLFGQDRLYVYAPEPAARPYFSSNGGMNFARRFAGIGDINGDGCADFVFGAQYMVRSQPSLFRKNGFYVISGKDGRVLREHLDAKARWGYQRWAGQCSGLLDIDGDGVRDYALGSPWDDISHMGRIYLFSGKTGKLLLRLDGTKPKQELGMYGMGAAGDIDGDGRPDLHVRFVRNQATMITQIRSSKTGKVLREHVGILSDAIGDVDGDKVSDYVRGYSDSTKGKYAGAVDLHSGKTGKVIRTWYGNGAWEGFGSGVAPAGDVNGDGRPDFIAAAAHYYMNPVGGSGYVKVLSSAGPTIWEWRGAGTSSDMFGYQTGSIGDADGDGRPDVYVFSRPVHPLNRRIPMESLVTVYSGKTGKRLWTAKSGVKGDPFGMWTKPLGDVNGDGFPDLAIGEGQGAALGKTFPTLHIVGGNFRSLGADKTSLSLSKAESTTLSLKAGPLHVGKLFLVLGSLSGSDKGMQYDIFRLPLIWDAYTSMTLAHPMGLLYTRGVGILAGGGKAQSRFCLTSWLPKELIGLTFTHSYVVFDLKKSRIDFVGEAVRTKILK